MSCIKLLAVSILVGLYVSLIYIFDLTYLYLGFYVFFSAKGAFFLLFLLIVYASFPTTAEVGFTIQTNLVAGEDYQVLEKAFSFANTTEATVKVNS